MTRKELLNNINSRIKSNANGEILNEILTDLLLYLDNKIGDLDKGLNQPLENAGDLVNSANTDR